PYMRCDLGDEGMQNSKSILNLILIGFHHRKGSVVELVYPSLPVDTTDTCQLPHPWRHLPSLAIADGAHNYTKDCTYFSLPSIEKKGDTVFGVACYRQADSASFVQPNPEITRNTVQKSLVVLSRFPLFSYIAHHLSKIIDSLFKSKGFTPESLQTSYEELSHFVDSVLNNPLSYQDALFYNLNASNFIRVYKRDALCLFKLLLLERRILFTGDSGGIVSNWMLTLLSLYPDMLRGGLSQCSVIDPSWMSEINSRPSIDNISTNSSTSCHYSIKGQYPIMPQEEIDDNERMSEQHTELTPINVNLLEENVQLTSYNYTISADEKSLIDSSLGPEKIHLMMESDRLYTEKKKFAVSDSDKNDQTSNVPENISNCSMDEFSLYSPFPTNDWGFPLSLFTKSYLAPLYISLGLMDVLLEHSSFPKSSVNCRSSANHDLTEQSVRGFIAGATNPLLRSSNHLTEVFVSSLSPSVDISENYFPHLSELTSTFEKSSYFGIENDPLSEDSMKSGYSSYANSDKNVQNSGSKMSSNYSRPFSLPKRSQPVIQINSNNITNKHLTNSHSVSVSLNRALQLSHTDRLFIDHLIMTVNIWYEAQTDYCQKLSSEKGELIASNIFCGSFQLDADVLQQLTLAHKTALLKFPSQTILDAWIRQQFLIYLRALLLSAQGYNSHASDFQSSFLSCFRSTRNFLIWRHQFIPSQLFSVSVPEPVRSNIHDIEFINKRDEEEILKSTSGNPDNLQLQQSCTTSPDSVAAVVAQHPGRKIIEPDDWNQITGGFKKLGNMADQGRRFVSQSVAGLVKFGSDFNSTFRSSPSSNFVGKFSDTIKSVVLNPISISSPIITTEITNAESEPIPAQINIQKT
ncbi:Late secretory pathway protein AVL9 isoform 1, partial [Schistosoma japonicum]